MYRAHHRERRGPSSPRAGAATLSPRSAPILGQVPSLLALLLGCHPGASLDPLDRDHDGWIEPYDCNDLDPRVHPDADELCDGVDNDCEGTTDGSDALDAVVHYRDRDGDGYGDEGVVLRLCQPAQGWVEAGGDCDDADPGRSPDADELCNTVDDDCDSLVDESDAVDAPTWYLDQDGDGYGTPGITVQACAQPATFAELDTDCDDADAAVHPGAEEVCDEADRDEDCDGLADVDDPDAVGLASWSLDEDGDGWGQDGTEVQSCEPVDGRAEAAGDCNDADDGVHPGAVELCGNGLDDDCDGLVDGGDPDAAGDVLLYVDGDGDGYGDASRPVGSGCDLLPGQSALPTDCDDSDAGVNPGATEAWYDGVDADCDGNDGDADGDGYAASEVGGADCDDTDRDVSPDAAEVCGNGLDDDCDGAPDPCAVVALWSGTATDGRAGVAVAGLADFDGDGVADLVVGADHYGAGGAGAAWLVSAGASGEISLEAGLRLSGSEDAGHLGAALAGPGDLDGDGLAELVVGAPDADAGGGAGSGAAWVVSGPLDEGGAVEELAVALLLGEDGGDRAGAAVAGAGDVDGDGWLDLVVGAPAADPGSSRAGAAYLLRGPLEGTVDLWLADGRWTGEVAGDEAGAAVAGAGDVDGDGLDDLLLGAPQQRGAGDYPGAAYLVLGPATAGGALDGAEAALRGEASGDRAGEAVCTAGDVDGDGYADVVVGAPERDLGGAGSGAAYLLRGPLRGEVDLREADLVVEGSSPEDRAGGAVLGGVDLDGDGRPDLVVGAEDDDVAWSDGGAVYVLLAPGAGTVELDEADLRLDATAAGQGLGAALARVPADDGGAEGLLVGAPHADGAGDEAGAAWLLPGW